MVKEASTVLFTVADVPTTPVSENRTSFTEVGAPPGVQLPAVDQLPLTPALHSFTGSNGGAVTMLIVNVQFVGVTLPLTGLVLAVIVTTYVFESSSDVVATLTVAD